MSYPKEEAKGSKTKDSVKKAKSFYVSGAILGHVDAGKTTLSSALTKAAAEFYPNLGNRYLPLNRIDSAREEIERGITINVAHIPFFFADREVSISDCPGHQDYIKNMISGAATSDFAILVVDGGKGVEVQTRQHHRLAVQLGIENFLGVMNKVDVADPDLLEVSEEELRDLFKDVGGKLAGVVRLSATKALDGDKENLAKCKEILEYMEKVQGKELGQGETFRLTIKDIYNPKGQGTIVTGKVASGRCQRGQEVEVLGMGRDPVFGKIVNLQTFNENVELAVKGMDLGVQIDKVNKTNVVKGMSVVEKGSGRLAKGFKAVFHINSPEKKGGKDHTVRSTRFGVDFEPQVLIDGIGVTCKVKAIEGAEYVQPGDTPTLTIDLLKPVLLYKGDRVIMRESDMSVGQGRVLETY